MVKVCGYKAEGREFKPDSLPRASKIHKITRILENFKNEMFGAEKMFAEPVLGKTAFRKRKTPEKKLLHHSF